MLYLSIFIFIGLIALPVYYISKSAIEKQKQKAFYRNNFPPEWVEILLKRVAYYHRLNEEEKIVFQKKIGQFLGQADISGVGKVKIDDTIRLLIAASAVIPVFHFEDWTYRNMGEILVYDGEVNTNLYDDEKKDGVLLGQVKPFQTKHMVLLSKQSLEQGFHRMNGHRSNVGIHEFVHLIDQADGDIDGIPGALMPEALLKPWTTLMYAELELMKKQKSDINPYGLTNHAEFFAVVSEYFFENPERFKKYHPELAEILSEIFHEKI